MASESYQNHRLHEWQELNKKVMELIQMGEKIRATKSISIPDGVHFGEITKVEHVENKGYKYTEIYIEEFDTELELKCGVPTAITENTALGMILQNFGAVIKEERDYDVEELLKGKQVQFMTITEKTPKGKFAKIISDSIKPKSK
jgi:hypothetical protein